MLRYFSAEEYVMFLVFYLVLAVGQNICWYSLISLLQLLNDFSIGGTNSNIRFHENAMVYIYGIMLGSLMCVFAYARFNLHGAKLGNKAKSGVLGLLYKKVSYCKMFQEILVRIDVFVGGWAIDASTAYEFCGKRVCGNNHLLFI